LSALEGLDQADTIALLKSKRLNRALLDCGISQKLYLQLEHRPRIVNIYGQTETIGAIYLPTEFENEVGPVPTGRPIATQIYILNCQLEPVKIGVPGELYVEVLA